MASTIEAKLADLNSTITDMRMELQRLREPYRAARRQVTSLRETARPLVLGLARAGIEQGAIADDFGVTRETIRRMEIKGAVDRGDLRAKPGSRAGEGGGRRSPSATVDEVDEMQAQLRRLREPYRAARLQVDEVREQARPWVVGLARLKVNQHIIATDFGVTRETIRRMEIKGSVDRGDPRIKPGSRTHPLAVEDDDDES